MLRPCICQQPANCPSCQVSHRLPLEAAPPPSLKYVQQAVRKARLPRTQVQRHRDHVQAELKSGFRAHAGEKNHLCSQSTGSSPILFVTPKWISVQQAAPNHRLRKPRGPASDEVQCQKHREGHICIVETAQGGGQQDPRVEDLTDALVREGRQKQHPQAAATEVCRRQCSVPRQLAPILRELPQEEQHDVRDGHHVQRGRRAALEAQALAPGRHAPAARGGAPGLRLPALLAQLRDADTPTEHADASSEDAWFAAWLGQVRQGDPRAKDSEVSVFVQLPCGSFCL
mmetsp:Transcript_80345/g.260391  ORF Transcript_80345/g.260391 Transcript_80345/m.260391 type:complete len:286 (+) Transcript_80345:217-1074(+)